MSINSFAVFLIVLLVGLGIVFVMTVSLYNRLVTQRNRYQNAFSQIDVQLKRRYDLIPNLVETARGYLKHERETLEAVIQARNQAASASQRAASNPGESGAMQGLAAAEGLLGGALGRLMVVAEQYPDLKADQTMAQLSEELTSTENKIAFARQAYNDAATTYNTQTEVFPASMIAGMFNFQRATLLEFGEERAAEPPKVSFA